MKKLKVVGIILGLVFIIIQFIPVELPEVSTNNPNDLLLHNSIDDSVAYLLKNSCYDCHSNSTVYPWYSKIAPSSWLVVHDINEGREHLNFSDWETFTLKEKLKALSKTSDAIQTNEMPFPAYLIIHRNAKLSAREKQMLITWSDQFGERLLDD